MGHSVTGSSATTSARAPGDALGEALSDQPEPFHVQVSVASGPAAVSYVSNTIRFSASSQTMPAVRPPGAPPACRPARFHVQPFHDHVSFAGWPFVRTPPNSRRSWVVGS